MEAKPVEQDEQEPEADYTAFEKDFVFPFSKYTKKEIKAMKIPPRKKGYLLVCEVCSSGHSDEKFAKQHIATKGHKFRVKEHYLNEFLANLPKLSAADFANLSQFVETGYTTRSALVNGQMKVRSEICEQLQSLVQKEFKDVTVQMHGSSVSQFALVTSNVNLNLNIPAAMETQKPIPDVMKAVVKILSDNAAIFSDVKPDYYSFNKIPRILFNHKTSGLLCEIRAMAGNPMMLAPQLQCYGMADQRVLKLGVVFHSWAKTCHLDIQENGHYPGHMFIVMVIHFLQQTTPPVVPVLHELLPELKKQKKTSSEDDSVSGIFSQEELTKFLEVSESWQSENKQSLGELWIEMLLYYTFKFDTSKFAVSIRQINPPLRDPRQWGSLRLAVEDPMIPKSNLARAASSDKVYDYYLTCLKQTAVYFYSILHDRGQGSPTLDSRSKLDSDSDLSSDDDSGPEDDPLKHTPLKNTTDIETQDTSIVSVTHNKASIKTTPTDPAHPPLAVMDLDTTLASDKQIKGDNEKSFDVDDLSKATDSLKLENDVGSYTSTSRDTSVLDASTAPVPIAMTLSPQTEQVSEIPTSSDSVVGGVSTAGGVVTSEEVAMKKSSKTVSVTFKLSVANCALLPYPKACINCKQSQSKHLYNNCPVDELPPDLLSSLPKIRPKSDCLHSIGEAFKRYMKAVAPRPQDKKERKRICDVILNDIRPLYPDAHLKLFGSSANGFGAYTSDLDICLILPGNRSPDSSQSEKNDHVEVIERISRELRKYRDLYDQVVSITTARVPIVKFYLPEWPISQSIGSRGDHEVARVVRLTSYRGKVTFDHASLATFPRDLECDISMENRLAMRNTGMLAAYASIDNRVRVLGYAVKHFAKVCDMGDASSGSLSSYAYILLMLHYLQRTTPPVIPVLQQLHPKGKIITEGPIINNWNCYYYEFEQPGQLHNVWSEYRMNNQGVGDLWLGFLNHILMFDWSKSVVAMRQLEPVSKFDKWWMGKPLCIEDPFNLEHNLGASVTGKMRTYILERFRAALVLHSQNRPWRSIDELMYEEDLVGESRAPKFLICNHCNRRGHRASQCPSRLEQKPPNYRHRQKKQARSANTPTFTDQLPMPSRSHTYPSQGFPHTAVPISAQKQPLLPQPKTKMDGRVHVAGPGPDRTNPHTPQRMHSDPARSYPSRPDLAQHQQYQLLRYPQPQRPAHNYQFQPQNVSSYHFGSGPYRHVSPPHSATPLSPSYSPLVQSPTSQAAYYIGPPVSGVPPSVQGIPPGGQGIPPNVQHYHVPRSN